MMAWNAWNGWVRHKSSEKYFYKIVADKEDVCG